MRLTTNCMYCDKPLVSVSTTPLGENETLEVYKCGHAIIHTRAERKPLDFNSVVGDKTARDYQKEGVQFIIDSDFNCVIADQMRLGKTPQSLLALHNYYEERTPALIIVRSANLYQWIKEYKTWVDLLPFGIFPIVGTKNLIPMGFSAYIISMDTFSRGDMVKTLLEFGFKLVIVDEAHSFKNTDSKRSQSLITFLKMMSQVEYSDKVDSTGLRTQELKTKQKCGVILLTGTPIKNRADEYFVPLNIVAPEKFPSLEHYRRRWLIQNEKGQFTRINPYALNEFKQVIEPYVLRREKEDVYKDLPELNRMFTVVEIDDERMKKAYNKILEKMEREMTEKANYTFFDSIGDLAILRQICGMAKVPWTADYIESSMLDSDNMKFAVGIHHHSVRDSLSYALSQFGTMKLSGEDSAEQKYRVMTRFETSPERVLIMNMLAGGVGMDFHYINNILILERQWSAADEEQFEFRFYNPDKSIKTASTNVEYILAKGTIDEWFYELVESKRQIFGETISTNWSLSEDPQSFKQLLEKTIGNRL